VPFVAGFFFFFASPELDGANVVAVFFTNLFKSRSKVLLVLVFGAAVVVVVVVVASSSSPSLVARGFASFFPNRARPAKRPGRTLCKRERDRFPDNVVRRKVVVLGVVVFDDVDDDVDANMLGSDSKDPLSATFILFVLVFCAERVCVSVLLLISFLQSSNQKGRILDVVFRV